MDQIIKGAISKKLGLRASVAMMIVSFDFDGEGHR